MHHIHRNTFYAKQQTCDVKILLRAENLEMEFNVDN